MYIRKVKKKNGITKKEYEYLYLVENYRTDKGPRQKMILNLGKIDLDPELYNPLATRIETLLYGQESLFPADDRIEEYAQQACQKLFHKKAANKKRQEQDNTNYQSVDINSTEVNEVRSYGPEHVCHTIWEELKLNDFFKRHGVPDTVLPVIEAIVVGRLIEPASELHTFNWAEKRSALYDLSGPPLKHGLSSYYRAGDRMYALKDELETYLTSKERSLFSINERYYFFDLTNTYFEGQCSANKKAAFGRSKEKRTDCKLVTLGLIVDESGFPKCSNLFAGNINETMTLSEMVAALEEKLGEENGNQKPKTIIMDAGIASDENLKWLDNSNYKYIVVNRGGMPVNVDTVTADQMTVIKEDPAKGIDIRVKRFESEGEAYVLCESAQKKKKEKSMHDRVEKLFLERLERLKSGLLQKNRVKKYARILEMIGRLKEKYSKVAKLYEINVLKGNDVKGNDVASDIEWKRKKERYVHEIKNEGRYILRTNRLDLSDKEIWDVYIMLQRIEYSFLCMKSHLGLRPNFHHKEERMDVHMFISVLAYHILHIIEYKLRRNNDHRQWATIRDTLKTHQRLTVSFTSKKSDGSLRRFSIRKNSKAEEAHKDIYQKLGIQYSESTNTKEMVIGINENLKNL